MRRINFCLLTVVLSPLFAFFGCPASDKSEPPSKSDAAVNANQSSTKVERSAAEVVDPLAHKQASNEETSDEKPSEERPADEKPADEESAAEAAKPNKEYGHAPAGKEELPVIFQDWPKPKLAIVISACQNGYIEPCGCIGLENQKGGLSRRATFLAELREKGWPLVLVDGGGLTGLRRYGAQAVLKYRAMIDMLSGIGYHAIAFGTHDLRLPITDLLVDVVEEKNPFVAANVALSGDFADKLTPDFRTADAAGLKIGITAILGKKFQEEVGAREIAFQDPAEALARVVPEMKKAKCDKLILLSHATEEETRELAEKFADFDVIVTAGGAIEPPTEPSRIEGQDQLIIDIGQKGSYVGVLAMFDDEKTPWRYERVPLDHRFKDSPEGDRMMKEYQRQLQFTGLAGLGLKPLLHPSGSRFVGTETCAECHTAAHDVWKKTPHAHGTESIVNPPERREPARHFDPECLSCHVTGWEPQKYYPFVGGYLDLEKSKHMHAVGCENCHGPGSAHVAAEEEAEDDELLEKLREQMRVSKETMKESFERGCVKCHDQDNDPHFEFDKYWETVKHYGKD